jgi:multicomponent Na+:H+ antiporter subunit D
MNLVALPILLPLIGAGCCLFVLGRRRPQAWIATIVGIACLAASCTLAAMAFRDEPAVVAVGGWRAPFGIVLVADRLGSVMAVLTWIVGLASIVYSMAGAPARTSRAGHYPVMLALLASVSGAFLTGDLFNLYVWFELLLISSFVLLTLGGSREQIRGAVTYVTLNLLSSAIFLIGAGIAYAMTGTLNMADLALRLDAMSPGVATLIAAPLLVAFAIKAALFPLYGWLPAAYHTPAPVTSALFAGLLTKVGVYALIRTLTLMADQQPGPVGFVMVLGAILTMLSGVLGAVAMADMRRILSFHIVSQIGYMLMGTGIAVAVLGDNAIDRSVAVLALAGAILYIMHHIVVKTNLFLIAGVVHRRYGTTELSKVSGILRTDPLLAGLFLFAALSLAGIPILSGFWAKLALVRAGIEAGQHAVVVAALVVSLLTLFSMMKIWTNAFWGEPSALVLERAKRPKPASMMVAIWGLTLISAFVAFGAPILWPMARATAEELLESERYIRVVLPSRPVVGASDEPEGVR